MKVILIGPPGSGKSTQARFIQKKFSTPHLSAGDLLRTSVAEGSVIGLKAKRFIEKGELVPNNLIMKLIISKLKSKKLKKGFILDGFPRTVKQAQAIHEAVYLINYIVNIEIPEAEIVKRLSGRLIHLPSGRTYHMIFSPPQKEGKDDLTGEELVRRTDEKSISKRIETYKKEIGTLVQYYEEWKKTGDPKAPLFLNINGIGTVEGVRNQIFASLE